jgi:hypothetical protein
VDSSDETVELARRLNFIVVVQKKRSSGANQKTYDALALNRGADGSIPTISTRRGW